VIEVLDSATVAVAAGAGAEKIGAGVRRPLALPAMAHLRSSSSAAKRRHSSRDNKITQPAILR